MTDDLARLVLAEKYGTPVVREHRSGVRAPIALLLDQLAEEQSAAGSARAAREGLSADEAHDRLYGDVA